MIQKIKELVNVKEELNSLSEEIKESRNELRELKSNILEIQEATKQTGSMQKEIVDAFKDDMGRIKEIKDALDKELYDFKLLKSHLQKDLLRKFEEELDKELKHHIRGMEISEKEYAAMRDKIIKIMESSDQLSRNIELLKNISANIKKEDFELTGFAKQLISMDKEKLELMKKIDSLERLIAKQRRSH